MIESKVVAIKESEQPCRFRHRWQTKRQASITKYQVCEKCGSKRIIQKRIGVQSFDASEFFGEK